MALIKCKECGVDVSTSAKACPKCGAKPPRKTSVLTWIMIALFVGVVYGMVKASLSPASTSSASRASGSVPATAEAPQAQAAPPTPPQWENTTSVDKMTGAKEFYATSPITRASEPMSPPYGDVRAWLGVGCNQKREWAFVGFSTAPNLTDTQTKSGYSEISTRLKWDDSVQSVQLTQEWGSKFLGFDESHQAISRMTSAKTALLELAWYGQNHPDFNFPMDGATAAIASIREQCKAK